MKEFFAKRKAHLFFGTAFLLALVLNTILGLTQGQTLRAAIWNGIIALRPMDYVMFALLWYACAMHPKDNWHSPLISLNLSRMDGEK